MAVLNIRKLPDEVHARLRVRAARAGRSMEAEARAILTAACLVDDDETAEQPRWKRPVQARTIRGESIVATIRGERDVS